MIVNCTNCGHPAEMQDLPVRGPTNDDAWLCLWCKSMVCIDCYHEHTKAKHPTAGAPKKKDKKKRKK